MCSQSSSFHSSPDSIEINCAEVADERVPVLKDQLQRWFDEAAWHAPSVIFFDDFDRMIPAEVEVSQPNVASLLTPIH